MKISDLKFRIPNSVGRFFLILVLLMPIFGAENEPKPADSTATAVTIVSAERNLTTDAGEFNVILKRSPADPRTGETMQFLVRFAEKVEGGFGGGAPVLLENATVTAKITKANGTVVSENVAAKAEAGGNYQIAYAFASAGDYKIFFNVATADNRAFSVDFPVSVASASVRSSFWIGLVILSLLTLGTIGAVVYAAKRSGRLSFKQIAPLSIAALLIFALGTAALAYFMPPRQTRTIAEISPNATVEMTPNQLETKAILTVPKESQILFGIKTEPIGSRQIAGGLKTTGTVRARPDARAVVVPPVAGKILLKQGLTIGSVVGKGEQIGTVEQILDVSTQAGLESQRLDAESRKREVQAQNLQLEAQRLSLQAAIVELNGRINEQKNLTLQAKTRLAQAQRELRRAENLVEVGAVPRKRLEEAQTAVKIAEQELANNETQVKTLSNQVAVTKTSAGKLDVKFDSVKPVSPRQSFPLTSPITGVIAEVKATSGQQVEAGTEILSVVNLATVLLEAQVFEKDLPIVRESTKASFTASALSGEIYTIGTADGDGRLVSVGQTVNEQTRTVSVIYEVKNPLNRLRDGMFVEMTIDTSGNTQVLAVPKKAVITEQGQSFVFIFDGGESFEKRAVALGIEGADFYEIKSGLKEGERVVTEGIYQLRSTQPS